MNSLNSILLEGNLIADPNLSKKKGVFFCKFSIVSNQYYKRGDEYEKGVSYFEIQTWAKLAEICAEYLKKGRSVRIVGRLKQDRWKGNDGKSKSKIYIIADHVEFKPEWKGDKDV